MYHHSSISKYLRMEICVPSSISTEPRPVWWEGGALLHGVCHWADLKVFFLSSFLPISHMRRTIDFGWMLVFYSHIFQPPWDLIYLEGMWVISLFYNERVELKKWKSYLLYFSYYQPQSIGRVVKTLQCSIYFPQWLLFTPRESSSLWITSFIYDRINL